MSLHLGVLYSTEHVVDEELVEDYRKMGVLRPGYGDVLYRVEYRAFFLDIHQTKRWMETHLTQPIRKPIDEDWSDTYITGYKPPESRSVERYERQNGIWIRQEIRGYEIPSWARTVTGEGKLR